MFCSFFNKFNQSLQPKYSYKSILCTPWVAFFNQLWQANESKLNMGSKVVNIDSLVLLHNRSRVIKILLVYKETEAN